MNLNMKLSFKKSNKLTEDYNYYYHDFSQQPTPPPLDHELYRSLVMKYVRCARTNIMKLLGSCRICFLISVLTILHFSGTQSHCQIL
ncbi:hypothetical protein QTP88_008892 [Uroleucon formosanum]